MQNHATNQLNIELSHMQGPDGCLSRDGKCLGKQIIERLTACESLFEFSSAATELVIAQGLQARLERGNGAHGF